MKAVRFHQHGGPDVLRYEDVPEPDLAPGEVLVRVRACALNHLDLWARRGLPNVTTPMPHISGSDVAGEVIASAAAVAQELEIKRNGARPSGPTCTCRASWNIRAGHSKLSRRMSQPVALGSRKPPRCCRNRLVVRWERKQRTAAPGRQQSADAGRRSAGGIHPAPDRDVALVRLFHY